jgi:DNA-binding HxlR family transcriptional regulator
VPPLKSVDGIKQKIRLKELENGGMIKRKIYNNNPVREGDLVSKKGRIVRPLLMQMAAFSLILLR